MENKKRILFIGVIFVTCFNIVFSQNRQLNGTTPADKSNAIILYEQANDYYDGTNGKFMDREKAISLYKQSADLGYSVAQYELARLYVVSAGKKEPVYISKQEALNYLYKLADEKNLDAIFLLYCIYNDGIIVPQDYPQANYWLHLGAELGMPASNFILGLNYLEGADGVEKDSQKAFKYLKKSAELEYVSAYDAVGWCYLQGVGIERDINTAKDWFRKGAESGDSKSQVSLADFYAEMDSDAVQAYYWYRKAAEQGEAYAQWKVGLCYDDGIGEVEKNVDEAIKWYRKSAEKGYKNAQFYLAERMRSKNPEEAFYWYNQAYRQGYFDAGAIIGMMLYYGEGCTRNVQKGIALLQELSEKKNARAMANYGEMLITGIPGILKKNKIKGVVLIREAAQMEDPFAQFVAMRHKISF